MKQERLKRVISHMEGAGLKQLVISDPDSIYYLTGIGYNPGERLLALYINDQGDAHLFNNHMFPQQPQEGLTIHFYDDTDDYMGMMAEVVSGGDLGVDKFWNAKFLLPLLEKRADLRPRLGSGPVDQARVLKDSEEIALMRRASAINDDTMAEVDGVTRKVISDAGYGDYFTHRTGHNIGLALHEPPDCSSTSPVLIQPGMCFSVEPGVYLPGKWGVRVEDLVAVTETGVEVLNHFTKDLLIIG